MAQARMQSGSPQSDIFFVATNGNDAWSGRMAQASKTDGPFATIPRALRAARESKQQTAAESRSPIIMLRGGNYFLDRRVVLTAADSGLKLAKYSQEKPIVSGGRQILNWHETHLNGCNLWVTDLPQGQHGWVFRELWVNGNRAVRARHPNKGYFNVAEVLDKGKEWTQGQARFRFREGDLKNSSTITNGEVVVMSRWVESRLPVVSIDEAQRTATFSRRSVFEIDDAA